MYYKGHACAVTSENSNLSDDFSAVGKLVVAGSNCVLAFMRPPPTENCDFHVDVWSQHLYWYETARGSVLELGLWTGGSYFTDCSFYTFSRAASWTWAQERLSGYFLAWYVVAGAGVTAVMCCGMISILFLMDLYAVRVLVQGLDVVRTGWKSFANTLCCAPSGSSKSTCFSSKIFKYREHMLRAMRLWPRGRHRMNPVWPNMSRWMIYGERTVQIVNGNWLRYVWLRKFCL